MSMLNVHGSGSGILTKCIRRDTEGVARVMSECDVLYIDNPQGVWRRHQVVITTELRHSLNLVSRMFRLDPASCD